MYQTSAIGMNLASTEHDGLLKVVEFVELFHHDHETKFHDPIKKPQLVTFSDTICQSNTATEDF